MIGKLDIARREQWKSDFIIIMKWSSGFVTSIEIFYANEHISDNQPTWELNLPSNHRQLHTPLDNALMDMQWPKKDEMFVKRT